MKIQLVLASLAILVLVLAACGGDGDGASWSGPEDLLKKQIGWLNDEEWEKAFLTCAPSYRETHSMADDVADFQEAKALFDISKFGIKDIVVDERDDIAYAGYTITFDGQDLGSSEVDHPFRKIDGVWYDDDC